MFSLPQCNRSLTFDLKDLESYGLNPLDWACQRLTFIEGEYKISLCCKDEDDVVLEGLFSDIQRPLFEQLSLAIH